MPVGEIKRAQAVSALKAVEWVLFVRAHSAWSQGAEHVLDGLLWIGYVLERLPADDYVVRFPLVHADDILVIETDSVRDVSSAEIQSGPGPQLGEMCGLTLQLGCVRRATSCLEHSVGWDIYGIEASNNGTVEEGSSIVGRVRIGKGTVIRGKSTVRAPSIIGNSCTIGLDAFIGLYTAIGNHCKISACEINDSIVMDGATVDVEGKLVVSLIGTNSRILSADGFLPKGNRFVLEEDTTVSPVDVYSAEVSAITGKIRQPLAISVKDVTAFLM